MSAHVQAPPSRDRVIAAGAIPLGGKLRQGSLVLAMLGMAAFVYGAATGSDRAWHAFQFNWLFFTLVASGGVMFVAVQRITTARWSRGVIRFLEGFAAFLPFAWLGLVLMILVGKGHVYP